MRRTKTCMHVKAQGKADELSVSAAQTAKTITRLGLGFPRQLRYVCNHSKLQ